MIHRLSPAMASVPTTLGGPAEPLRVTNAHRFLPYLTDGARATVRKLRGRQRGRGSVNAVTEWGTRYGNVLTGLRTDGLLDPGTMRSAEFNDARLRPMLAIEVAARILASPSSTDMPILRR